MIFIFQSKLHSLMEHFLLRLGYVYLIYHCFLVCKFYFLFYFVTRCFSSKKLDSILLKLLLFFCKKSKKQFPVSIKWISVQRLILPLSTKLEQLFYFSIYFIEETYLERSNFILLYWRKLIKLFEEEKLTWTVLT